MTKPGSDDLARLCYNLVDCGFRLVGMVAQGSTPWIIFGPIVFVHLVLTHFVGRVFSDLEVYMKLESCIYSFVPSLLEVVWSIEINVAAGALSA